MSVNRASEVWKEIKPFAIRDMNRMLDNKAGDSGDDLYAIILYDESAQKIKYYSMSNVGLAAALGAASSGDVVWVPAGEIEGLAGSSGFLIGSEISSGPITLTSEIGDEISGLVIGNWYAIECWNGYFNHGVGYPLVVSVIQLSDGSGFSGIVGQKQIGDLRTDTPSFCEFSEIYVGSDGKNYGRIYFQATTNSVFVRVYDGPGQYVDNGGTLSWRLREAMAFGPITIPSGVEVVGLGKNSIIDVPITNNGILTNIQVTETISGTGICRMVPNPTFELFSNQIKSLIESGTAPFIINSNTVNENLNADLLDGEHASAFADAAHTHTESDITDLDHNAEKIDGIAVDLTGITDGQIIKYDVGTTSLIAGDDEGGGALADLTDVDLTGLADGDVLVFDETSGDWLPETPAGGSITVEEQDGTPSVSNVNKIKVTNGTLTDAGSGVVSLDFGSAATDGAAIHDNEANEISAITEKATPADDDLLIIEDSEASYVKKSLKISNLPTYSSGGGDILEVQVFS